MSRKNKTIRIVQDEIEFKLIGLLSQVLPHELMLSLSALWQIDFKKFSSDIAEGFEASYGQMRLFLVANTFMPKIQVDYLLVILGKPSLDIQLDLLSELKKNDVILGAYELTISKKQLSFLLHHIGL